MVDVVELLQKVIKHLLMAEALARMAAGTDTQYFYQVAM